MKRIIISLITVVMLIAMMLPADIAMARGHGDRGPTATNQPSESQTSEYGVTALVADFVFDVPECPLCEGVTFTDKSTGGVGRYKYDWDFGDGGSSSKKNPTYYYASYGNYTVTLTVTDRAGDIDSTSKIVTLDSAQRRRRLGGAEPL